MADIGTAYIRIAPNMTGIQGRIASGLQGSGGAFASQFGGEFSAKSAVIIGAVAGVAQAAVTRAMSLVSNSIGDAISRVDTLARFPTVMQNLGYSAQDASKQIQRIATNLIGLPTSLDSLTTFVQRVAPVSGSLERATDVALAFNNAVLAGGGPVYRQADAIEQFSQMLSKGKPDLMAWRTLQEAMPATLSQIAKQLGISTGNTQELYDAMQNGTISFDDFTNATLKLNKEGLPGFKNFAQQAKDSTSGIATGMQNAQTAITRGVAKIIDAVGQKNISEAIGNIGKGFETVLNQVATYVPPTLKIIGDVFAFVSRNKDIFIPLAAAVGAAVVAFKTYNAVMAVTRTVTAAYTAVSAYLTLVASLQAQGLGVLRAAWLGLNIVMAANPIGLIIAAVAALVVGLVLFFTKTETGKKIMANFGAFIGKVWEGIKVGLAAVGAFFTKVWDSIKNVVGTVFGAIADFWNTKLKPVFDVMVQVLGFILGIYIKIWAFIALVIVGTMAIIFQTIWSVMQSIWGVISSIWNTIYGVISTVVGLIWTAVQTYFNFYLSVVTTIMNAIWGVITTIWNAIYGFIAPIVSNIANFISGVFNGVWSTLSGIWNNIFNTVSGALGRIWGAVTGVFGQVVNFIGGIGGRIIGALGNLGSLLYNSGRDLINGLLNGAGSLLSNIAKFFLDKLPGWIQGPFKSALGIHSPSTVFAGYGKDIGQGTINGIKAMATKIKSAVSNMAGSAVAGMTPIDPSMAGSFNSATATAQNIAAGQYEASPKVVQNIQATIHDQMDLNKVSSDLGYAVAMA